ncbi:hypothetical protein BN14_00415 [Rhizoctonia solani AG-1 IB]|uniref:Uncharacterized protein n=1 Tax=Thanatephorus cucumeris (strain AG1-IB / isolate 7/3/14) TaxID=1108050 RepID=M5BRM4_THACB|nr:hypothetical protein BN14_00415 [Rhizoctonia solani AG-1 IB]
MGEIDDIFSGKSKAKGSLKEAEPNSTSDHKVVPKKRKKKGKKPTETEGSTEDPNGCTEPVEVPSTSTGTKRKIPETVIDPSLEAEGKKKKSKSSKEGKKSAVIDSDDERFRDSRGTGPRRKTEEGYLIYKEDELGINDEAGG